VKDSIRFKLDNLVDRQEELNALLSQPETMNDQNQFRKLSIELSDIGPVIENYIEYKELEDDAEGAQMMMEEDDKEIRKMAHDELSEIKERQKILTTTTTYSLRFELARAAMKPLSSQVIYLKCIKHMLSHKSGVLKS